MAWARRWTRMRGTSLRKHGKWMPCGATSGNGPPGLDADHFETISCPSTVTGDFVLDRFGHVVVGAVFSGHGFKFTATIGRILADLCGSIAAPERFRASASR